MGFSDLGKCKRMGIEMQSKVSIFKKRNLAPPSPPAVEAWSLNHWTATEVPLSKNF